MEMTVRFNENDDMVVDNIPDDMMAEIERRAQERGWTAEDEVRDIFIREYSRTFSQPNP